MPWLRLGPHGRDAGAPPFRFTPDAQRATFTAIYHEIDRLAGRHRRSPIVRLHCFSESFALAGWWRAQGVAGLLLTDRDAVAYHLDAARTRELAQRGRVQVDGLTAHRTHERIENLAAAGLDDTALHARLDAHLARHGHLVLCTHEADLQQSAVVATALRCLRHARARGCVAL
jgi:hypothetical protein